MDMYRFVAICENDSTSKQLTYTPENFEGVKISQEFSFTPPYGFTPKNAVDSMRVIKDDAAFFISKNVAFGYFLKMKLYVSKLNADGITYSAFITLVVNYDTISQTKDYCEFSVDVINSATDYFNTKSTPKNILFDTYKMPAGTYYKINNVNVNSIPTTSQISGKRLIDFEKSEGVNIIFDGDLSLYDISTIDSKKVIYQSKLVSSLRVSIKTSIIIDVFMSIGKTPSGTVQVGMQILSGVDLSIVSTVWSETRNVTQIGERFEFLYDVKRTPTLQAGEFLVFYLKVQGLPLSGNASVAQNNVGITIKKKTILEYPLKALKSISLTNLFGEIFGDISFTDPRPSETWITSDREVVTNTGNMVAAPKDIARELSIAYGFVYNFNKTETKIEQINDYFKRLNLADRIKIEIYKDLSVANYETVYNSLTSGVEKFNTENIVYFEPIQTKLRWLTVDQDDVVQQSLGDDMELVCTKLSPDSEKIINRIYDAATDNGQSSNDNFYLVPQNVGDYSDILTPNDMANNHLPLLALYFSAWAPYFLLAVDNDGIGDLKDYYIRPPDFWDKKQLKPFVYEFTALIGEADFSEHFAEMVDFNGDTVDLFVYSSETTDQLGEIKCKALVFK